MRGLEAPKPLSGADLSRVLGRSLGGSEWARVLVLSDGTDDICSYHLKSTTAIFTQNNCGRRARLLGAREQWGGGGVAKQLCQLADNSIKASVKN